MDSKKEPSAMREFLNTPLFGMLLSILAFEAGIFINKKTRLAVCNAFLISILLIIAFLTQLHISLRSFNIGGDIISFFLGPATVILAVPIYKQWTLLKANLLPVLVGITVGCVTAITSIIGFSKLFGLQVALCASLVPKSVTTPIGIAISKQIGGIPAITVAAIIITGIVGAVIAPFICKVFRIKDKVAVGVAIGASSHAIGTTKALELGETEGAMSGLTIGIAGLFTVFLAPIFIRLLG
jgi:predicted murein hydrolase (TIGR00659 family)